MRTMCAVCAALLMVVIAAFATDVAVKPSAGAAGDVPTIYSAGEEVLNPVMTDADLIVWMELKEHYYELVARAEAFRATDAELAEIRALSEQYNLPLPATMLPLDEGGEGNGNLDQGSTDTVANCASATVINTCPYITTGFFDGDNDCSVINASPYNEVFYTFTPTVTGYYQFRARSFTGTVPAIRVVSGGCCAGAVAVAFSSSSVATDCQRPDSAGNEQTTIVTYTRATLTAGVQYWIHVGTSSSSVFTSRYDFRMDCVPCPNPELDGPTHNTCATAQALAFPDSVLGDSAYVSASTAPDWYTFVKQSGYDTVEIFVGGREYGHCISGAYPAQGTLVADGRFTLYKDNGSGCPGDSIGYDDDSGCSFDAKKRFCLTPGRYYIKVWNYSVADYILSYRPVAICPPPIDCETFFPCGTPAEIEPNNTCADAPNFLSLACGPGGEVANYFGTICPQADVDYWYVPGVALGQIILINLFEGDNCDIYPPVNLRMRGATAADGSCAAATGTATAAYILGTQCQPHTGGFIGVVRTTGPETKYRIAVRCSTAVLPECPNVVLPKQFCSGPCVGPIPDVTTVYYPINVTLDELIDDVNVRVNIVHTYDADLDMYLITPWNDTLELSTDNGSSGDNYQITVFDDEGVNGPVTAGVAPFNGSYIPEELLAGADGFNALGTWTLLITDDVGGDVGYVNCWCIEFESRPACVPDEVVVLVPDQPMPGEQTARACAHLVAGVNTNVIVPVHNESNVPQVTITPGCQDCGDPLCTPLTGWILGDWVYSPAPPAYVATLTADPAATGCCVCISLDFVLPVELASFTATAGDGEVSLNWRTASETNASHFEIARDGTLIARVDATNNASGASYQWTDANLINGTNYRYSLTAVGVSGVRQALSTVEATPRVGAGVVTEYALRQNYPNPFNPSTSISFDLVESGFASLRVYNLMGQMVANLVSSEMPAGRHTVVFDATSLSSGVYLYRLEVNGFVAEKKMLLMK